MGKILLVDNEIVVANMVRNHLINEGYQVNSCHDGENAVKLAYKENPDLVIMELDLPKLNGFEACQRIRRVSSCPIIILTAKGEENNKVHALNIGADDYIVKPFGHKELLARIKAHLRRYHYMEGANHKGNCADSGLEVIPETFEVKRDGKIIDLTQREFELLMFLVKNPGKVYTREQLLEFVWGFDYFGDVRTVDVTIHRLREKIENNPGKAELILTKRGFGYYFKRG